MTSTDLDGRPRVMTPAALMTADELLVYPAPHQRVELVRGRLAAGMARLKRVSSAP